MAKRAKVTVRWKDPYGLYRGGWWIATDDSSTEFPKKAEAVRSAARTARAMAPSELWVFTKAGRIGERRTYQGDPERRPG